MIRKALGWQADEPLFVLQPVVEDRKQRVGTAAIRRHPIFADFAAANRSQALITGHELLTLKGHGNIINGLAFSPEGKWLASSRNDD